MKILLALLLVCLAGGLISFLNKYGCYVTPVVISPIMDNSQLEKISNGLLDTSEILVYNSFQVLTTTADPEILTDIFDHSDVKFEYCIWEEQIRFLIHLMDWESLGKHRYKSGMNL